MGPRGGPGISGGAHLPVWRGSGPADPVDARHRLYRYQGGWRQWVAEHYIADDAVDAWARGFAAPPMRRAARFGGHRVAKPPGRGVDVLPTPRADRKRACWRGLAAAPPDVRGFHMPSANNGGGITGLK